MPIQELPGYTTAFKNAPWCVKESPHYRVHYMNGSLAEKEIENIVQTQENAYKKITEFLELPQYPEKKIDYYLYPDAETKKQLMGSEWFAQSVWNDFAVHALYTEEDRVIGPHEDTHLLSLPLGLSIGFLQEGLAEYMVGQSWHGESFEEIVQNILANPVFTISDNLLTSHSAWRDTNDDYAQQYYALAALFTGFLIEKYDKEKYIRLYQALARDAESSENKKQYEEILSIAPEHLFIEFLETLN